MKQIILRQITLINFKGIKNLTIDFDEKETSIYGRNGSGKTTIFDALTWLLFGKDSQDRKVFDIKTLDSNGNPIPKIPHEVSARLIVGNMPITLTRRYKEKWVKKRGQSEEEFTGHEEERLFNDVPCNLKEWNAKIADICTEEVFKFITSPSYFSQQKTEAQRAMLIRMAGGISDAEIASGNPDFMELVGNLTGKTLEEYKKEIASKKAPIKAEVKAIPERIDERRRDTPEAYDYSKLEKELESKNNDLKEVESQINDIVKAANAANDKVMQKVRELSDLKQQRLTLEYSIKDKVSAEYRQKSSEQKKLQDIVSTSEKEKSSLISKNEGLQKSIDECKNIRERLLQEWHSINAEEIHFDDNAFVCPTCHRPLEIDDIERKQSEMTANFNSDKRNRLNANNSKGKRNNADMNAYIAELNANSDKIKALNEKIEKAKSYPLYSEELQAPDTEMAIANDKEYTELSKKIALLSEEVEKPSEVIDNSELETKKSEILKEIDSIKQKLATRDIAKRNDERIAELEKQLKKLSEELAQYEKIEFTIQQFSKARIEAIEGRINAMFKIVRFKMFAKQINGGEVETCEATVDGVPYSSLNHAMQINAGIDIINAICEKEQIEAPIVIDNAESVLNILPTQSQVIKLIVADTPKLKIVPSPSKERDLFNQ